MSRPTISVCVATYNQRSIIETSLRSILNQDVDADVHVVVGDDASTDGTSEIVESLAMEYGAQLQHCRRSPNMGAFANMCDLVAHANGDYVARVDGDDYWLPGKLAKQLDYLREHVDCTAVYTNAITVNEAGNQIGLFNDVGDARFDLASLLRHGNFLNNSSILFRGAYKSAWLDVEELIDYQLHLQLARYGWLGHIGEPLAAYRVSTQGSMVSSMNNHVRKLYWQAIRSVPRELITDDDLAHGIADFMRRVFYRALRTGQATLLKEWMPCAFAASPYGATRTSALALGSIIRMAYKELIGCLHKDAQGRRSPVLYRR